jgi:hypothetical protein
MTKISQPRGGVISRESRRTNNIERYLGLNVHEKAMESKPTWKRRVYAVVTHWFFAEPHHALSSNLEAAPCIQTSGLSRPVKAG